MVVIRVCLLVTLMMLAACAPRARLFTVDHPAEGAQVETVLVASNRLFLDGQFTGDRVEGLRFAQFEVVVPPDRESGEIAWPRGPADPETDFLVQEANTLVGDHSFRAALRQEIAARPADGREVMVYVHGFNNTFADGLFRTAQVRHDFDLPVIPVHYSWPSAAHPLGYVYDRDSALFARDGLEALLTEIVDAGAGKVSIMAHSLGTQLVMETLRQLAISGNTRVLNRLNSGIILVSPDIDIEVFRAQAERIGTLPQPFFIFASQRDRALRISAQIRGQDARLGNIESIDAVSDLDVIVVDVSEFGGGRGDALNHATPVSSAAMIQILSEAQRVSAAFEEDEIVQSGLLPGVVRSVSNATQIVLSPSADLQD